MHIYSVTTLTLPNYKQSIINNKRLVLPFILFTCLFTPSLRDSTLLALNNAFFQVSVFVAATLLIYHYAIDHIPQLELSYLASKSPLYEVSFASVLGALPGCGGAIIVVTQFTKGQASFGAIVAVLTATMGDAAFLLLATRPKEGLLIMFIGLTVGTVTGLCVNYFHKSDYLRPTKLISNNEIPTNHSKLTYLSKSVWMIALVPSLIVALLMALNTDFSIFGQNITDFISYFGAVMALFIIITWAIESKGGSYKDIASEDQYCAPSKLMKIIQDTHFVTAWVVTSFMIFEIVVNVFGLDLKSWFISYAYLSPLIAVLIGFLPGCGPQIIVTTLYIQGFIPFSALVGNTISNDGDALFPAIAMAPKAAIIATIYTAIPALLISYSVYFFVL
jgi:hypothetical protein